MGRHGDDGEIPESGLGAKATGGFKTVENRHLKIQKDEIEIIRWLGLQPVQGRLAVNRRLDFDPTRSGISVASCPLSSLSLDQEDSDTGERFAHARWQRLRIRAMTF